MKTSNKLLIAFGLALILLPMIGIAVYSRVFMKPYEISNESKPVDESFDAKSPSMIAIPMPTGFKSVNIKAHHDFELDVRIINDKKYGVKITSEAEEFISAKLNNEGELEISVKKLPEKGAAIHQQILIYGTSIGKINLQDINELNLSAQLDSLTLNATNSRKIWINDHSEIHHLTGDLKSVNRLELKYGKVKAAILNLTDCHIISESNPMKYLKINAAGNSTVDIWGLSENQSETAIDQLIIYTLGSAKIKIENATINDFDGSFSDSTIVNIPAMYLNKMYKSKK